MLLVETALEGMVDSIQADLHQHREHLALGVEQMAK